MAQHLQPDELSELEKYFKQAWSELEPLVQSAEHADSDVLRRRLAQLMISLRSDHQHPDELVAAAKQLFIQQHAAGRPMMDRDTQTENPRPSL